MKRGIVLCVAVLQCLSFLSFAKSSIAQDLPKENSASIPKPEELGQFFSLRDGKLTPLQEEKNVSSYDSFPAGHKILKIKGAFSPVTLEGSDKLAFVVHLADKSIRYYSLRSLKQEKNQRTFRPADPENEAPFSTTEYADGFFLLTLKSALPPGQYVIYFQQNWNADFFYSFAVK